jgi:DNA-binding MarR family transcriptional regulator
MASMQSHPAGRPTAAQVADEFGRAAKILVRRFDERLGEHGVSTPRSRVLAEVLRLQPVRVSDVSAAVGIAQGTASVLVEALAKEGLIRRETDPHDGRATLISLTEEGTRRTEAWQRAYEAAAEDLLADLPPGDRSRLITMLRAINSADDEPATTTVSRRTRASTRKVNP